MLGPPAAYTRCETGDMALQGDAVRLRHSAAIDPRAGLGGKGGSRGGSAHTNSDVAFYVDVCMHSSSQGFQRKGASRHIALE